MASFDITAQINLRGPTNVKKIAADIRKQLGSIKTNIDLKIDPNTAKNVSTLNSNFKQLDSTLRKVNGSAKNVAASLGSIGTSLNNVNNAANTTTNNLNQLQNASQKVSTATKQVAQNAQNASTGFQKFGKDAGLAVKRIIGFRIGSAIFNGFTSAVSEGIRNFIEFERALAKVQQVTGSTDLQIKNLSNSILDFSKATGAAASSLAEVSVVLSQAGLSARETETALQALAQTTLAPTFGDIRETAEGAIAILRQFGLEAEDLNDALGSINAVAGQFAVSASDVIVAVKQAGAVFASSSKGVAESEEVFRQFIATFTSVRQTTRESAETIGTGLKTIVTRLQRLDTIESLKNFGIQLTDLEGKFVGPFEAIKRLSEGLQNLDPRDIRFGAIIEELGGFRQVGKVIPLIQQYTVAQEALKTAQEGTGSIADQAIIAQATLGKQLDRTAASFQSLITTISNNESLQTIAKTILTIANAAFTLAEALSDVLPALLAISAVPIGKALAGASSSFIGGFLGKNQGGPIPFARGGYVPGQGNRDTIPAMLTPGEFVIRKKAVESIGVEKLGAMNNGAAPIAQAKNLGGSIQKFAGGGQVQVDYVGTQPNAAEEQRFIGDNMIKAVKSLAGFYAKKSKIPVADAKNGVSDDATALPNYKSIVGGVFEAAIDAVAATNRNYTNEKLANNAVWDYPQGLPESDLFSTVGGQNYPVDAKKNPSKDTILKKVEAHYRNAEGSELNRTKFGIVTYEDGADKTVEFDVAAMKANTAEARERIKDRKKNAVSSSQKAHFGGLIQRLAEGDKVLAISKNGRVTKADIAEATSKQLEETLKNPAVQNNPTTTQAIKSELVKRGRESKAENVGVVGILPINYAKDLPVADYGGTFAKIHARGLPKKYEETVLNISKGLRGVVDEAAKNLGDGNTKKLTPEQEKATGLENVQGTIFEAVLSALGATGGTIQNQAIDYQNGLGPAARIFPGIGPDWPTEVKRDVTGAGMSRAKGEFTRFFKEKAQARNLGGIIKMFADGGNIPASDTVPAMLTPGEFVINKKAAKRIGLPKLKQMNYADRVEGFNKGGPVGGIQYFNNGGSPNTDPSVAFANMGGTLGVQAAKTNAQAANVNLQAANANANTANQNSKSANQNSQAAQTSQKSAQQNSGLGKEILLAFSGPALKAALAGIAPNSAGAAAVGEAASQGITQYSTFKNVAGGLGEAMQSTKIFGGRLASLGGVLTKFAGGLGVAVGVFSALKGALDGYLRKTIELTGKKIEAAGKDAEDAFKKLGPILADINATQQQYNQVLKEGADALRDQTRLSKKQAADRVYENNGGFFGGAYRALGGEAAFGGEELRKAQNRTTEREVFQGPADQAEKVLESIVASGKTLEEAFASVPDELEAYKEAIALSSEKYRAESAELQKLIDGAPAGSAARELYQRQLNELRQAAFEEKGSRLQTAIILKEQEKAYRENAKALAIATISIKTTVSNFSTALSIATDSFDVLSREAKSAAEGFAGVVPEDVYAQNITVLDNPGAFSDSENRGAISPLAGILGESQSFFEEFQTIPGKLEDAIKSIASTPGLDNAEQGGQATQAAVLEIIQDSFGGSQVGNAVADSIRDAIEKATPKDKDGKFDASALLSQIPEIIGKFSDDFRNEAKEALAFFQDATRLTSDAAQKSAMALGQFNIALGQSISSQKALNQQLQQLVGGPEAQGPESIRSIDDRTVGEANSRVTGAGDFAAQTASLQKQLLDANTEHYKIMQDASGVNKQLQEESSVKLGELKGQIVALQSDTKNLQSALSSKLDSLKGALGKRLQELKEAQAASESLFERLLSDEGQANEDIILAQRVAAGEDVGPLSGEQAIKVLRDIATLQKAGIIAENKQVEQNKVRVLSSSRGLGERTASGRQVFNQLTQIPAEDEQVQEYVREIQNTNTQLNAISVALAANDLVNSNKALEAQLAANTKGLLDLTNKYAELTKQDKAQNINPPVNKATGGIIYRSKGGGTKDGVNWQPRGTDTIPAMLTPGEFVVNAKSTKANRGLLESINSSGSAPASSKSYSKGGILYRQAGGGTSSPADEKTLWDKVQLMLKGGNSLNIMSLGWTDADEVAKFANKWTTMPKWLGGWKDAINTSVASKWSNFKDYAVSGLTKNMKAPQWILDAAANGLISTETADDAIRAGNPRTWKNLIPRAIGRVAQSNTWNLTKSWASSLWAGSQSKLASIGSIKWIKNLGNIGSSPILKTITGTVGKGLSKGLGVLGIAEHLGSGISAGLDRTETLQQAGASAEQILISSVAEILAGGTSPAPDDDTLSSVLGAGFQNNLRLLSAIGTGASTGGLTGAVAAAATVAVGQGIRLGEETIGLLGDRSEAARSERAVEEQDASIVASNLQSGTVDNSIKTPYEVIGELQHSRARSVGRKLSYKDWYTQNQGLFDSFSDYNAEEDPANNLGMYATSKLDFAFNKLSKSTDLTFDPKLKPTNRGYWDGYSEQDYQDAYAEVVAHYAKNGPIEPMAYEFANMKGAEGNKSPSAEGTVGYLQSQAQNIKTSLFGDEESGLKPQLDKYENDPKLMQIAEDRGAIYEKQASLLNNSVLNTSGSDKESQWLNKELQTTEALKANRAMKKQRIEELKLADKEKKAAEKEAKAAEQKAIIDANTDTTQTIANLSIKDFDLSTKYPYITNRPLVKKLQENSIAMRLRLEKQPTFNSKGELEGPPLGDYLDFLTGAYTPNDALIQSDPERDFLISLGSAISAYSKNYKQAAPFYETVANPKQFDDFKSESDMHKITFKNFFESGGDENGLDFTTNKRRRDATTSLQSLYRINIIKALGGTLTQEDADSYDKDKFEELRKAQRDKSDREALTPEEIKKIYADAEAEATKKTVNGEDNYQGYYNELALMVGRTLPIAESKIFGYNFYTGDTSGPSLSFPQDDGALSEGIVTMANLVPNDLNLYPGLYKGGNSKIGEDVLAGNYIKTLKSLRLARTDESKEDFGITREQEKEDARKKATEQQKRLRAVENYSKVHLLGSAIPKDPAGYLDFRQEQSRLFSAAVNNLPGESYPMPTDLPAFKEAGVSSKWVKRLFTLKDSDLVNNVSQETAKALLYWKAQFDNGFATPEDLIGKAAKLDGVLGLDDIYPKELRAGNPGEAAAGDLTKITERVASAAEDLNKIKGGADTKDATGRRLLEKSMIKLKTAGLWNPESAVTENLSSIRALSGFNLPLENFFENYNLEDLYNKEKWKAAGIQRFATGGQVMGGMFTPRGSDTVPAMLTPGEYVVNRKAAQANKPLLEAINGTNRRNSKKGYYDGGGEVSDGVNNIIAIDVQEISAFVSSFDRFSKELANLSIPSEITVQGTHTVEVNINGAQVLNDLLNGPIGELVGNEIQLAFQQQNIESEGSIPNPFA